MKKLVMVSLVLVALAFGGATLLWAPDPGTPGKPCSPGFWKNHTELWLDLGCGVDEADLHARGPGSGEIRHAAAAALNACYFRHHGTLPCKD